MITENFNTTIKKMTPVLTILCTNLEGGRRHYPWKKQLSFMQMYPIFKPLWPAPPRSWMRVILPLNILLRLLYRCDGGLYQGDVVHFCSAPCTLVWECWPFDRWENRTHDLRLDEPFEMGACEQLCACLTFVVQGLVRGLWCGTAALCVLAAAGRLAAGLSVLPVCPSLRMTQKRFSVSDLSIAVTKLMANCIKLNTDVV